MYATPLMSLSHVYFQGHSVFAAFSISSASSTLSDFLGALSFGQAQFFHSFLAHIFFPDKERFIT
jgi:hypothetical protein